MRGRQSCLLAVGGLGLLSAGGSARAHSFSNDSGFYQDFVSGNEAVFLDLRVATGLLAAGLLFALWDTEGLVKVWLGFLIGNLSGLAAIAAGGPDPFYIQFALTILAGLAAAAAISLSVHWMRALALSVGAVSVLTILLGHELGDVPVAFMLGNVFGLNVLLAITAGIVSYSLQRLPYAWVRIAWRSIAAWLVAVAMMTFALELSLPRNELHNMPDTSAENG